MFLEWNSSKRCLSVLQVMTQGERAPQLDRTIDPQLLKMALAPHPRLRAALFPSGVSAGGASSDISIYHLLQVSTSLLNSEYPSWARKRFKRGGLKSGCHDSPGWMRTLTAILALCCSRSTPWIPAFCLAGKRQTPSTPLVRPPLPHPPYTHRCCPVVCFRYHQQGWSGLDSVWHLTNNFFANLQSLSKQLGSSARTFNRGILVFHLMSSVPVLPASHWPVECVHLPTEASELPHFSNPHLVSRHALVEKLDFLYYIRHGRPSFAFGNFLLHHLSLCGDVRLLWVLHANLNVCSFCQSLTSPPPAALQAAARLDPRVPAGLAVLPHDVCDFCCCLFLWAFGDQ